MIYKIVFKPLSFLIQKFALAHISLYNQGLCKCTSIFFLSHQTPTCLHGQTLIRAWTKSWDKRLIRKRVKENVPHLWNSNCCPGTPSHSTLLSQHVVFIYLCFSSKVPGEACRVSCHLPDLIGFPHLFGSSECRNQKLFCSIGFSKYKSWRGLTQMSSKRNNNNIKFPPSQWPQCYSVGLSLHLSAAIRGQRIFKFTQFP